LPTRSEHADANDTARLRALSRYDRVGPRLLGDGEYWIPHYEAKGYHVLAPAYPGLEVEVEALNADPTPVERLTVPAVIAHLESIVGALDAPPILMGHSAGGTFVQILLDRGFGAAGVTFNSAPTEGVLVAPWSQIRATFPVLKSPANRGAHVVRATSRACVGRPRMGHRAREPRARSAGDLGQLPEHGAAAAAVHLWT
jgi:hypothetical protein